MEQRINVNGVWYVKEVPKSENNSLIVENDCINYLGCDFENNKWGFEAIVLTDEKGAIKKTDVCSIKIRSKMNEYEDWIDSRNWMLDFINGNTEVKHDLKMGESDLELLKEFIVVIKDKGWLNK